MADTQDSKSHLFPEEWFSPEQGLEDAVDPLDFIGGPSGIKKFLSRAAGKGVKPIFKAIADKVGGMQPQALPVKFKTVTSPGQEPMTPMEGSSVKTAPGPMPVANSPSQRLNRLRANYTD